MKPALKTNTPKNSTTRAGCSFYNPHIVSRCPAGCSKAGVVQPLDNSAAISAPCGRRWNASLAAIFTSLEDSERCYRTVRQGSSSCRTVRRLHHCALRNLRRATGVRISNTGQAACDKLSRARVSPHPLPCLYRSARRFYLPPSRIAGSDLYPGRSRSLCPGCRCDAPDPPGCGLALIVQGGQSAPPVGIQAGDRRQLVDAWRLYSIADVCSYDTTWQHSFSQARSPHIVTAPEITLFSIFCVRHETARTFLKRLTACRKQATARTRKYYGNKALPNCKSKSRPADRMIFVGAAFAIVGMGQSSSLHSRTSKIRSSMLPPLEKAVFPIW